jgi:hypothetical protein
MGGIGSLAYGTIWGARAEPNGARATVDAKVLMSWAVAGTIGVGEVMWKDVRRRERRERKLMVIRAPSRWGNGEGRVGIQPIVG